MALGWFLHVFLHIFAVPASWDVSSGPSLGDAGDGNIRTSEHLLLPVTHGKGPHGGPSRTLPGVPSPVATRDATLWEDVRTPTAVEAVARGHRHGGHARGELLPLHVVGWQTGGTGGCCVVVGAEV